jgi:hypothetical protein
MCGAARGESNEFHQPVQPGSAPPATTRPTTQPRGGGGFPGTGWEYRHGGMGPRFFLPGEERPTEEQIKNAEDFVSRNSPNHFRVYQRLEKEPRAHEFMQGSIVRGYLDLQVVYANDRPLYDLKLKHIQIQDQIFGVIFQYRQMGRMSDANKDQLHADLRPLEAQLLEVRKSESKHRLDRIKAAAAVEQTILDNLETPGPNVVDGFIDQDIQAGDRLLAPFGYRRVERRGDH